MHRTGAQVQPPIRHHNEPWIVLRRLRGALVGACVLAAGCNAGQPGQQQPCAGKGACPSGEICVDSSCRQLCNTWRDCTGGTDECSGGLCTPSVCGNGIIGGGEECDVDNPSCVDCKVAPGTSCDQKTCTANNYRVALMDDAHGWVDVVDLSAQGTSVLVRTYTEGYSAQSPWPEWSADGTQLAYPGGQPMGAGSVYLYDVPTDSNAAYAYFSGDQPNFAPDRAEVIARQGSSYVTYSRSDGAQTGTIAGFSVNWPKWDPGEGDRFAYLDLPTGSDSGALIVQQPSGDIRVAADGVHGYSWLASGTTLFFLQDATSSSACDLHAAVVGSSSADTTTLITGVPCDAGVVVSSDGNDAAIAEAGKTDVELADLTQSPVDFAELAPFGTVTAAIHDVAWTPDDKFVAVLHARASGDEETRMTLLSADGNGSVDVDIRGAYRAMRFSPEVLH